MKKLLFFVTEDWYFVSHRLDLAIAAKNAGYNVVIVTQVSEHESTIVNSGLRLVPIKISRGSLNPFKEIKFLFNLFRIYKAEKPDIVHQVTLKPVIYGTIISRLTGVSKIINAIAGLGFLFRSSTLKARILKRFVGDTLRYLLCSSQSEVILQNPDDAKVIQTFGVDVKKIHLIKGAGVDTKQFKPSVQPERDFTMLIATRMLWDKGVGVFVDSVKILKDRGIFVRGVLVGACDNQSLNAISTSQLQAWNDSGIVEWWGKRSDMPDVLNSADVICLPSNYGEGIPKVLIEAASCGKAIVTTDTPGCREIVVNDETGILIPVENPEALADAIERLTKNVDECKNMGHKGRQLVLDNYTVEKVISQTLDVYKING